MINIYVLPRIREVRKEKGITQAKLAKKIGMEQTQYSRYERGENEIKVNVLIDICKALDVSADYILGLTDEKNPTGYRVKNITNVKENNGKIVIK